MYSEQQTTDTYNTLLNGRWHTGIRPNTVGQLAVEQELIMLSSMNSDSVVLDFGCGPGLVTHDYWAMTGARVFGVTNQPSQIRLGQSLGHTDGGIGQSRVQYVLINDLILPFPDDYFDIIVSTEALCHIIGQDKVVLFNEFRRVLKPAGKLVYQDWAMSRTGCLDACARSIIEDTYHVKLQSLGQQKRVLTKNGFNVTATRKVYPQWNVGLGRTALDYFALKGLKLRYPHLYTECPFPPAGPVSESLLEAGRVLQESPDFYIVFICGEMAI